MAHKTEDTGKYSELIARLCGRWLAAGRRSVRPKRKKRSILARKIR
nr:hypothetical protein P5648_13200 [Bacillus subtilis]